MKTIALVLLNLFYAVVFVAAIVAVLAVAILLALALFELLDYLEGALYAIAHVS